MKNNIMLAFYRKSAFTLAEVLITLAIIGVVAAIVLPSFINNYQSRVRKEQVRTVLYKFTKATDQMKSQGKIGYYNSTEAFVNELKKSLKIAQICSNDNLGSCWPTKIINTGDGKEVAVKDLKTGKQFGTEGYTYNNVGIVTADGTPIILSYKDDCTGLEAEKTYIWTTEDNKPVTNATTACVAMIFDINGKSRPNKTNEDVQLFHVSSLNGGGLDCYDVPGTGVCITLNDTSIEPFIPPQCEEVKDLFGIKCTDDSDDYWSSAMKACYDMGGRLPTVAEVAAIASIVYEPCNSYGNSSSPAYACYNSVSPYDDITPNMELLSKLQLGGAYIYTDRLNTYFDDNVTIDVFNFNAKGQFSEMIAAPRNGGGFSHIQVRCVKP